MRTLEELNLVDDFLVNSLTSHKIYGAVSYTHLDVYKRQTLV